MKHILITSMLALGIGCGAAVAQTQPAETQSGGDSNCAAGAADCQKGSKMKMGEQAQGKAKAKVQTDQQAQGKPKLKTDEQAQGKAGATTDQQAQGKTKLKTDEQAQGKAGATTDQQAQGKTKLKTDEQAQGKAGATTDQQTQGKTKLKTDDQAQGKASTQTDQGSTASITNVTVEQKTQITQVIKETRVEPVSNVDFDISVGIEVPRHKIRLHRLPARIVKIVPAYETYEYFVLADGRIVIVDPDTLKIVLILT
ncbi:MULTISPECIES: DUF1236 domain-containing protein [unclassified Mesorhizobium]|uniref:DUF1236 domain-containing protein n=1 Tax=unclassified Mesorhizobium TaxID=325217 RepID=UPI000FCC1D7E|nr:MULTISPECIES: DUF1236 domain-containing protein [unclassified Mesorhizobium]RUX97981.1 DUF1236 domain-containing protein [Mesorhizobium sp. M7D.F.Ca.US.004.01.2.1]RVA27323.1 DUF1236 domain-containing protein [Mesorhizobium sp. M7D.F.Ca.US.004.03.1.1]